MRHSLITGSGLHAPSRETVINNTGVTLNKLKVVRLLGMGTSFPQVDLSNPNLHQNFGIVVEDILNGQVGKVCCLGFLYGLNTAAWAPGTLLFADISGNLSSTPLGTPVASVVKQNATTGVLYVTALSDQITPPSSSDWGLNGNNISTGSFLGTLNNQALNIRTNNVQRATFDANGRFGVGVSAPVRHIEFKNHNTINSSGVQIETFDVSTTSASYQNIYTVTLTDPSSVSLEVFILGKDTVTGDICSFKRTGTFFRNAGNTSLAPNGWQSTYTSKTSTQMNITYALGTTDVDIKVKGLAAANPTDWVGYIIIQELKV